MSALRESIATSARPLVSVIIPVYNGGDHIRECLASFRDQDYRRHYEVILVDNGSTDGTARIAAGFPEVRYVYFNRSKSSYAARNEGARHARGDVLVFFDADQSAKPSFLTILLDEYAAGDPNHIYVGRLEDDPRVPRVLREFFPWLLSTEAQSKGQIQTAAVAVPRALFERLGGFKEHLLSGGDFEFFERAVRVATVHKNPQPGASHYYARGVGHYLKKEQRGVFGQCLMAKVEGRPGPRVLVYFADAAIGCLKRGVDAMSIPLRYPAEEWPIRWQAHVIRCLKLAYRLRAVVAFKLGAERMGDLPHDARVSASRRQSDDATRRQAGLGSTAARVTR